MKTVIKSVSNISSVIHVIKEVAGFLSCQISISEDAFLLRSKRNRKGEVNILINNLEPWWLNALVAHKISFYHWIKRRHQGQLEYMMKTFMASFNGRHQETMGKT